MAILRVIRGAVPGQILPLTGEQIVMGRHPDCQICLDNASVSRQHAQILVSRGQFYIEDLRSRNQTFLNGTRVEGRKELKEGDEVKICDTSFRFHCNPQVQQELLAAEYRRLASVLSKQHVHYTGSLVPEIQEDLIKEDSVGREILRPDFHGIVVLDAEETSSGTFDIDSFLRYAYRQICLEFGHHTDPHTFHPEQVAQVLKDEAKSLFCFLNVQRFSEEDVHRLRGLGFTQGQHQVLYCGPNDYIATKSTAIIKDAVDETVVFEPQRAASVVTGVATIESDSSFCIRSPSTQRQMEDVMDFLNSLAYPGNLETLASNVLDGLFKFFPQADDGFVLLKDETDATLVPKAVKTRNPDTDSTSPSMTIIRQAMENREAIVSAAAQADTRFNPATSLSELKIRSIICVPLLSSSGQAMGVIQIATQNSWQRFSQSDLDLLAPLAKQTAIVIENAQWREKMMQHREMERDLEVATQIQLSFLPSQRPRPSGYELVDYYRAAENVGGDYLDYVPLANGSIAIAIGDVAGKGIPAALLMARLYSAARFHLLTKPSVAEAMTALNAEIASSGLGFRFITGLFGVLDPENHQLTITNAGFLPPLLRRANGEIMSLANEIAGMPLGVMPDQAFEETVVPLDVGDTVLAFTDGVTDIMNPQDETYGVRNLRDFFAHGPENPQEIVNRLIADVNNFSDGRTASDDMCVVCLRRES